MVDKLVIKEVFVRILRLLKAVKQSPLFLIRFSEDSITDPKLMNWLVELLEVQLIPKNTLALEIKADEYLAHKKKIVPLIKYLRDTHNISFLLSNVKGQETLKECCSRSYFEYVKLDPSCIEKLTDNSYSSKQISELVETIREQKSLSIIPMIESAAILSTTIQCDPDLLQGYFIDEPQSEIVHTNTIQLEESEGAFNYGFT